MMKKKEKKTHKKKEKSPKKKGCQPPKMPKGKRQRWGKRNVEKKKPEEGRQTPSEIKFQKKGEL